MHTHLVTYPPIEEHTHTVVFLHGRGDTAKNFATSIAQSTDSRNRSLVSSYPSLRWVFPTAPVIPTEVFGGGETSQWFDVWTLKDPTDREELQVDGLRRSVALVKTVVVDEARRLGWRWDRLILAGISQGAVVCVHALLNLDLRSHPDVPPDCPAPQPDRLGAVLGFSTWMALPGRPSIAETCRALGADGERPGSDEVVTSTPILLEHCSDDQVIDLKLGHQLRETLQAFGADVTWKQYPDGRHWFHSPTGMDDVVAFLSERLGLDPSGS